jgi:hypothetical protein
MLAIQRFYTVNIKISWNYQHNGELSFPVMFLPQVVPLSSTLKGKKQQRSKPFHTPKSRSRL